MIYNLNLCCRFPSWVDIDLSQKRRCGPELLRSSPSHFRVSDANWWNTFHKSKHHSYLINTYILFCYPLFTHDFSFSISSNVYLYKKKDTFIFMFSFFFLLVIWKRVFPSCRPTCQCGFGCHTFWELVCRQRTAVGLNPEPPSGKNLFFPLWTFRKWSQQDRQCFAPK